MIHKADAVTFQKCVEYTNTQRTDGKLSVWCDVWDTKATF